MGQNILFLYLNTGNGHITPARHIKKAIEQRFSNETPSIYLEHGFAPQNRLDQFFFEKGYNISSAFIPAAYTLFYEITRPRISMATLASFSSRKNFRHIARLIKEKNITKIVCFHFAVTPTIFKALEHFNLDIPVIVVVTDPFTAHPSWFLFRNRVAYVVFSDQMQKHALMAHGVSTAHSFPFILSPEISETSAIAKKKAYELREDSSKTDKSFGVLIAGGGEGLSNVIKIVLYIVKKFVQDFATSKTTPVTPIAFTIVCGRNVAQKLALEKLIKQYPQLPLTVHGFVHNMPELLSKADCVISKAGASTVFEVLAMQKPLIITRYIHGQELGNVEFVVQNGCGWFIRKSSDIYKKILQLKNDPAYYAKIVQNAEKLNINSQLDNLADFIYKPKQ